MTTDTLPTLTLAVAAPASPRPLARGDDEVKVTLNVLVKTPDGFIGRVKGLPTCSGEACAYVVRFGGYPATYPQRVLVVVKE